MLHMLHQLLTHSFTATSFTWVLKLSRCSTDLGLTSDTPLLTSDCLRPVARRPTTID